MKPKFLKIFVAILLIFSVLKILNSCKERDGTSNCFPLSTIDAELYINSYVNLQTKNWDYSKGEEGTGTRGLIIFYNNSKYIVYDRNAPHICPDTNTTLEVIEENGFLYLYCAKDGAKWWINDGSPRNSQATGIPKSYYNYIQNGILYIYN